MLFFEKIKLHLYIKKLKKMKRVQSLITADYDKGSGMKNMKILILNPLLECMEKIQIYHHY